MSSVNKVILVGNAGRDPEVRYTTTGRAVGNFTVATTEKFGGGDGQAAREETEWHSIVVWGRNAELAQQYIRKGRQLYIEGRLQTRDWEKDGVKHYKTEVVCTRFLLLGRRDDYPAEQQQPAPSAFDDYDLGPDYSAPGAPLPPLSYGD